MSGHQRLGQEDPAWIARVKVPRLALALSIRQLGQMLQAGVHLVRCLQALTEQASSPELAEIWWTVQKSVASGSYLSQAMLPFGRVFDANVVRLVRVGESTGGLVVILLRLADWLEREESLRRKVSAAMAYPLLVLCISAVLTLTLVRFVLPPFLDTLVSLKLQLPWPTRVLMLSAQLLRNPGWILLLLGALLLLRRQLQQAWNRADGRYKLYVLSERVPLLHRCLRDYATIRLSASAAQLLGSGVDVVQAWGLALDASGDPRLQRWREPMRQHLMGGEEMAEFFRRQRALLPALFPAMLQAGESSGRVAQMMGMTSKLLEEDLESELALFTAVLQPLLLGIVSATMVFFMLALFMPIYSQLATM